jgi:DNA uptake protein ComE-like DNA-binding protein
VYYQLEAVPAEGEDVQAARMSLEGILDQWLSLSVEAKPEAQIPKIDLAELDELPWTTYKTKEPAKEGEAGWIFANTKGAEELAKAMQKCEGKLELGAYEYRFSGKEKNFITRKPVKK